MILSLDNITYFYKNSVNIYQNQSLSLSTGLYFFKGKNGVGKSTLFKIINQELSLSEGNILFDDVILNKDNVFNYVSFMRQVPVFLERLTVKEHLLSLCNNEDKIKDILNKLDLSKVINQKIKSLSLGEKQRLSFASIYILDRPIILLDEPFAHVNDELQQLMIDVINELKDNKIIIIISHDELNMDFNKIITYKDHKLQTETLKENNDITYQFKDLDKFNFKYVFKRYFYNYLLKYILVFFTLIIFIIPIYDQAINTNDDYVDNVTSNINHPNNSLLSSLSKEECKNKHPNATYIDNAYYYTYEGATLRADFILQSTKNLDNYTYSYNYMHDVKLSLGTSPSKDNEILIGVNINEINNDILNQIVNSDLIDIQSNVKYKITGIYNINNNQTIELMAYNQKFLINNRIEYLHQNNIFYSSSNKKIVIEINDEATKPIINSLENLSSFYMKTPFKLTKLTLNNYELYDESIHSELGKYNDITLSRNSYINLIENMDNYNICFYQNEQTLKKDFQFGSDLNFNFHQNHNHNEYFNYGGYVNYLLFAFMIIFINFIILAIENRLSSLIINKIYNLSYFNINKDLLKTKIKSVIKLGYIITISLYSIIYFSLFITKINFIWLLLFYLYSILIFITIDRFYEKKGDLL